MNPEVVPEGRPIDPEKMPALHRVIRPKKGNYRFKLTIPEKLVEHLTYPPGYEHEGEPVKEKTITETLDGKTVSYAMSKRVSILNALWDEQLELAEQRKKEAERNKTGNPENPPMDGSQDIDSMTSPEIDRFLTNLFRKKYIETASYRESLQNFTLQAEIRHHRTSLEQTVGIIGKVRNWADSPGHGNEEIRPFDPDYDEQITSMFREFLRDLSSSNIKAPEREEDFLRNNHRLDIFRRHLAMVQEVATNNLSILGISDYGDERDNWQSHLEYTNEILELAKPQSKNHAASPQTGESAALPNAEASQATIGKSIDEYLETYYSKSRRKGILRAKGSTAYAAESRYLEHIKKYFGKNTLISTLDTKAATRFVSDIVNHSAWNPKTMLNYVSSFRNFCKWMVDVKEWFPKNPVRDFHINMLPPKTGLTEEEIRLKMPTEPQLQILFSCERYIGKSRKSAMYWVPLILLHSGMRAGEACWLRIEDIMRDENGIDYFRINSLDASGKQRGRTKSKQSNRKIPIHSKLIELGFLDFCKERANDTSSKSIYLFPELKQDLTSPKAPSDQVTRFWSGNTRKEVSVVLSLGSHKDWGCINGKPVRGAKGLHSFRHLVKTYLLAEGIPLEQIGGMCGWGDGIEAPSGAIMNYGDNSPLKLFKTNIERLQYKNLDLSHLM